MARFTPRQPISFRSEVRFWTVMAVVMAITVQVLFPAHLFAARIDGTGFTLCNMDTPVADQMLIDAVQAEKTQKSNALGKKCVDCVLMSLTALPERDQTFAPVVYAPYTVSFLPENDRERPKARAPPRPPARAPPVI